MAVGKTNINTGGGNLPLTVQAADVRLGKTFTRDCKTVESGTLNLSNLKAENIKKGVTIGGVEGILKEISSPSVLFSTNYVSNITDNSEIKIRTYTLPDYINYVLIILGQVENYHYPMQYHKVIFTKIKSKTIRYNLWDGDRAWVEVNGSKYTEDRNWRCMTILGW